jgi:anthranilate synthase component 2
MLLIIDNYDSFTFNLVHYFLELGAQTKVVRNDEISVAEAIKMSPQGVVLSPGPCDPDRAGICLDLIKQAPAQMPILGVCLGHQAIGQAYGGDVITAKAIMHGKTSLIEHDATGVFADLPSPFIATRYHSLSVDEVTLPDSLRVTARTADGEIMGLCHKQRPIHGVQFHPESIASEHGHHMLRNFLDLTRLSTGAAA